MMSKLIVRISIALMCFCLPLSAASEVIGDFEGGSLDGWAGEAGMTLTNSLTGVTRGLSSAELEFGGGWGSALTLGLAIGGELQGLISDDEATLSMDITAKGEDLGGYCSIAIFLNCNGFWGNASDWVDVQAGAGSEYLTSNYEFELYDNAKAALGTANGYAQIGIMRSAQDGATFILYFDNIMVNFGEDDSLPFNPVPADNDGNLVPVNSVLSWNLPIDQITGLPLDTINRHYIYGTFNNSVTDPNMNLIAEVAATVSSETGQYPLEGNLELEHGRVYKWQIIEGVNTSTVVDDPNNIVGPVWTFETEPEYFAPTLTSGSYITTVDILASDTLDISATVTKNTEVITNASVELLTDGFLFPVDANYSFADTTSDNQNPTATFSTDIAGTYHIKVSVTDAIGTTVEKISEIVVFSDSCAAQKDSRSSGWVKNYYDINSDCVVDIIDFADMAIQWMADSSLDATETYSGRAVYVPTVIYDARIEAESVGLNACSNPPIDDDNGIRIMDEAAALGSSQVIGYSGWGTYLEYQIEVEAAVYDLWVSSSSPNSDVRLQFGTSANTTLYGNVAVPSSGGWEVYVIDSFDGALDFTSTTGGTITVRITWPSGGSNLDWFTLVKRP